MAVDPDRPSTWVRFTNNSLCRDCWGTCCTLPLEVKLADLVHMGLVSEDEALEPPKKISRRLISDGYVRSYRTSTELFMMEPRASGDCQFLNEQRLCRIYEKRPEVCRKFPAIGPRPGFCPKKRK